MKRRVKMAQLRDKHIRENIISNRLNYRYSKKKLAGGLAKIERQMEGHTWSKVKRAEKPLRFKNWDRRENGLKDSIQTGCQMGIFKINDF